MGRISHALRGLKRCLRPAAINVTSVPGFTKTTIDPLPIPKRPPPPSLGKTPRPAGQHKLDAIDRQVHNLTAKLYPPLPTGTRADPEAKRAIGSERAFASAVEALFVPSGASVEAKAETAPHLHNLLQDLTRIAEAQPDAVDSTRYAGMLQCARALAAATGGNAADACAALAHLRTHFSLTDGSDNAPPSPEQKQAWSAAKLLAHTASGFDALLALRPALAEVDAARPDDGMNHRMKREGLRTFLQAADHLAARMPADTPGALLQRARSHLASASDRHSLAGDGLAVHALLCAADLHADPGKAAHAIGDRTQVAAYVAWRSGYREGGKGSALERSLGRMNKFTAWARRAEHRANHRLAAFDPRRLLGMRKTPVIAAAYGTGGANLGLLNGESKALYDTVQEGIEAMLAHSVVLRRLDGGHALPTERRGLLLLREAVLEHWRAQIGTTWRSSKLKLTQADKQDIKRAVRSAAHGTDIDAEAVLGYREFRKLDKLDLKTLAKWIDEAASADSNPAASPMLRRAKAKIVEAGDIARGRPIKLKGTTLADFRDAMTDAIGTMPLGNYVRYFDGGTYGLNANMTVNQHEFTHNSPVPAMGLGPGAKALHGRHAFVEIGSSSYGGEVFIGTDKRSSTGAGLGAYAGLKFGTEDWHLSAGFSAGVAHSQDRSAPAGVIIRTGLSYGADGKATSAWRDNVAEVTRFLFQTAALGQSTRPVPPERMWEQFAERFFRTPDISVNWRDQRRSSETVTKHGSAAMRVAAGPVRLGPAFSVGHDHVLASKNDRVDTNGWLRGVERARARLERARRRIAGGPGAGGRPLFQSQRLSRYDHVAEYAHRRGVREHSSQRHERDAAAGGRARTAEPALHPAAGRIHRSVRFPVAHAGSHATDRAYRRQPGEGRCVHERDEGHGDPGQPGLRRELEDPPRSDRGPQCLHRRDPADPEVRPGGDAAGCRHAGGPYRAGLSGRHRTHLRDRGGRGGRQPASADAGHPAGAVRPWRPGCRPGPAARQRDDPRAQG